MFKDKTSLMMTLLKGRTLIVLVLLLIFFSVANENFLSTNTLLLLAKHVALYGILAIGMTYVIITGGIDLSVGAVVGLAGMIAGGMIQNGVTLQFAGVTLYFSVPMVVILTIVVGAFIGWLNGIKTAELAGDEITEDRLVMASYEGHNSGKKN